MSEPIKAGDLAIVVRDCCGASLGAVLKIAAVHRMAMPQWLKCAHCGRQFSNIDYAEGTTTRNGYPKFPPTFWLKKIDPPAVPETVEHEEEIRA